MSEPSGSRPSRAPEQRAGARPVSDANEIRPGEVAVPLPEPADAGVVFIGRIRTPWMERSECPRQGRLDGPVCRIELLDPWAAGLDGLSRFRLVEVLYWLDRSRRDLVRQSPRRDGATTGVFSLRSPARPNPIGTALAALVAIEGASVLVRGLDCVDGTPLIDLKPDRCAFSPAAEPRPGGSAILEGCCRAAGSAGSPGSLAGPTE